MAVVSTAALARRGLYASTVTATLHREPDDRRAAGPAPDAATLDIPGLYKEAPLPLSAIILSHTHPAHYGALFARPVRAGIKVFMTEIMEDTIRVTTKMRRDAQPLKANIHYFRKGHKFIVGRFVITPYLMDHTAAESFAFLIESDGKRVIYTGDYREHGNKAAAFKQFLAVTDKFLCGR